MPSHRFRRTLTAIAIAPMILIALPVMPRLATPHGHGDEAATSVGWDWLAMSAQATETQGGPVKWTCPMHPHYIADEFGPCPICGMDLVKLDTGGAEMGAVLGESRTIVTVAPETLQNMGVRIALVERVSFGRTIRSFGTVAENERLQSMLTARLEGWVEDLRVSAVGDRVKKGDLLFTLYAPELIVSQRDYLQALATRDADRRAGVDQRLRSFGVQEQAIKLIAERREVMERVPFFADRDGTVAALDVVNGAYVKRGMMLTKIQDYTKVWLIVNVAENDLPFLKQGTPATVSFPNTTEPVTNAAVDYIYPTVDAATRTARVRLVLDNAQGTLRPGAYADVTFDVGVEARTAVPAESVLRGASGAYVVAALGDGRFEPRPVQLGLSSGRWTEIKSGVEAGERIVVSGQFMLDSESALRESFKKLERLALPLADLKLDATQMAMIDHITDAAIYLHEALVDGFEVQPGFLDPAKSIKNLMWPSFRYTKLAFVLTDAEQAIAKAQAARSEGETRAALAELVAAIKPWMMEGAPEHYRQRGVSLFRDAADGRLWVQRGDTPANPYGDAAATRVPWPDTADAAQTAASISLGGGNAN
jgi:Cu(I)/Ag(I) efflux system membrane fusion protein